MPNNFPNNRSPLTDNEFRDSLPKKKPPYLRSKEQVWKEMEEAIQNRILPVRKTQRRLVTYLAAASIILICCSTAFLKFYTKSYETLSNEHLTVILPDGSIAQMNENSLLNVNPYWWHFLREVELSGEAFFDVKKGKRFDVVSTCGATTVMGTSFNIFARKKHYEVTCHTGKVRVTNSKDKTYIDITPNEKATINTEGKISKQTSVNLNQSIAWVDNIFHFTATPINEVFEILERHYNIKIESITDLDYRYSGKFSRGLTLNETLTIICRSLSLEFEQKGNMILVMKTAVQ